MAGFLAEVKSVLGTLHLPTDISADFVRHPVKAIKNNPDGTVVYDLDHETAIVRVGMLGTAGFATCDIVFSKLEWVCQRIGRRLCLADRVGKAIKDLRELVDKAKVGHAEVGEPS